MMLNKMKEKLVTAYRSFKTKVWTPHLAPIVMPALRFLNRHKVSIAIFIGGLILFAGMAMMPPLIGIGLPFLLFAISFFLENKLNKAMKNKERRDAKTEEKLDLEITELKQKTNPALTNAFGQKPETQVAETQTTESELILTAASSAAGLSA